MHGTPVQELFSRSRRDVSHGCIRLEDPVALAEWVLKDEPMWPRERILAAMNGTVPRRVDLRQPIQVVLYYITAVVMPEDGAIRFAEDNYGHDTVLDRVLTGGDRPRDHGDRFNAAVPRQCDSSGPSREEVLESPCAVLGETQIVDMVLRVPHVHLHLCGVLTGLLHRLVATRRGDLRRTRDDADCIGLGGGAPRNENVTHIGFEHRT
jgi:hypothetical protein